MKISPMEMDMHYDAYRLLTKRREKGRFVKELSERIGVNKSTIHRAFNDRAVGERKISSRADKMKARAINPDTAKLYAMKIAAAKQEMATKNGKTASTDMIVRALYNAGEIDELIPTATANRWMNWHGYSFRQIRNFKESAGNRLFTTEPNKWWFVDSSTSEIYYLRDKNGKVVRDESGILTDKNHREEILTRKGYKRICIFMAVDLYSSAYYCNAYVTPGESASVWIRFLLEAFSAKDDPRNPFRGIPENIYTDKGSALHSGMMKDMLESLNIKLFDHLPGNAKAKGKVESRIGHFKNGIERILAFENVETIERYRELILPMVTADNVRKGFFSKWMEIYQMNTLRELNPDHRQKLGYATLERKVNNYGCVKIENAEYLVSRRLRGEWVNVYTLLDGSMKAIDRNGLTYKLSDISTQYREMGTYKAEKKSDYTDELTNIADEGKRLRGVIKAEHFLEELPANVMPIPRKGEEAKIQIAHETSGPRTLTEAWMLLHNTTGLRRRDLSPDYAAMLTRFFEESLTLYGEIPNEKLSLIIDDLTTNTITEAL